MKSTFLFFFVFLVSSSLGNPSDHALLVRNRREVDFIGNTQLLVKELIQNLENAAQEAIDATKKFNDGLQEQAKLFAEKVMDDLMSLRERVNNMIKSITDRFTGAGAAVRTCVESFKKEVDVIFVETAEKSKSCADERIQEIGEMIENLKELSSNATSFASNAVDELKNCRGISTGFLATGSCFGGVAVRTEFQGAVFLTLSGLLISRINLAIATLPAALEVCAGTRLVAAGISSAKFVVDIGTCSASSVYSTLAGNELSP
ncbi:uncharacterized protein LOC120626207 [Pararge aegeria]|uniref:Jg13073 protein n=1 Tax=Pararge aegeria aegeria TaxID=348720 RepID=A0A8S4S0Q8_9NEOP|nr:uncharacterized protein LOC120626207 [Pararge aegeria]CAH2243757.1 jg13073 [Pararge aegeria aegeria]